MIILTLIIALLPSLLLHEFAHFFTTIAVGGKVKAISLGFGKVLYQFKYKHILYKIRLIIIGGDCELKGERQYGTEKDDFCNLIYRKKVLISISGCLINILIGLLLWLSSNIYLEMIGIINLALGICNLIPIPCLDGSIPIFIWAVRFMGQEKGYKLFMKINKIALKIWIVLNILSIPWAVYYITKLMGDKNVLF
jgi:membrane-associated protease RseP (regulator of RpoE activity)